MHNEQRRRRCRGGPVQGDPVPDSREHQLALHNADASPLLRLPPEIRNRIYALVLTIGQIHIRYRPWRYRKRIQKGAHYIETVRGGFYAAVLRVDQDPWAISFATVTLPGMAAPLSSPDFSFRDGGGLGVRPALTLLSPVCRQLYRDTACLPFALNAWSFENTRIMERYLLREKRLALVQRRAIALLIVQDLPPRAIEACLGGLRLVIWKKNGHKFQRWDLLHPGKVLREQDEGAWRAWMRAPRLDQAWHLYQ